MAKLGVLTLSRPLAARLPRRPSRACVAVVHARKARDGYGQQQSSYSDYYSSEDAKELSQMLPDPNSLFDDPIPAAAASRLFGGDLHSSLDESLYSESYSEEFNSFRDPGPDAGPWFSQQSPINSGLSLEEDVEVMSDEAKAFRQYKLQRAMDKALELSSFQLTSSANRYMVTMQHAEIMQEIEVDDAQRGLDASPLAATTLPPWIRAVYALQDNFEALNEQQRWAEEALSLDFLELDRIQTDAKWDSHVQTELRLTPGSGFKAPKEQEDEGMSYMNRLMAGPRPAAASGSSAGGEEQQGSWLFGLTPSFLPGVYDAAAGDAAAALDDEGSAAAISAGLAAAAAGGGAPLQMLSAQDSLNDMEAEFERRETWDEADLGLGLEEDEAIDFGGGGAAASARWGTAPEAGMGRSAAEYGGGQWEGQYGGGDLDDELGAWWQDESDEDVVGGLLSGSESGSGGEDSEGEEGLVGEGEGSEDEDQLFTRSDLKLLRQVEQELMQQQRQFGDEL